MLIYVELMFSETLHEYNIKDQRIFNFYFF